MEKKILKEVQEQLSENKSVEAYNACLKFIPNAKNIIGVRMPIINELAKQYKTGGFALVTELWKSGMYEERILAAKILGMVAKKDPKLALQYVKDFSKDMDNWALCDTIGMQSLKPLVKTHREEIFALAKSLNNSKNFWQRRLSLVLVEWYTRDIQQHPAIEALIKPLLNDKEYYVKKAITWIEKNFSKGK